MTDLDKMHVLSHTAFVITYHSLWHCIYCSSIVVIVTFSAQINKQVFYVDNTFLGF